MILFGMWSFANWYRILCNLADTFGRGCLLESVNQFWRRKNRIFNSVFLKIWVFILFVPVTKQRPRKIPTPIYSLSLGFLIRIKRCSGQMQRYLFKSTVVKVVLALWRTSIPILIVLILFGCATLFDAHLNPIGNYLLNNVDSFQTSSVSFFLPNLNQFHFIYSQTMIFYR